MPDAPIIEDELDPGDSYLTAQRYIFHYCDLCRRLGFLCDAALSDDEIRSIDYQLVQTARRGGITSDDIELTIWFGSQLARRLDEPERDIYAQSFTVGALDDEPIPSAEDEF